MIIRNRIKCKKCGDVIESNSQHDFKLCSCESIFVDGGHEYLRWGGKFEDIEDMSVTQFEVVCKKDNGVFKKDKVYNILRDGKSFVVKNDEGNEVVVLDEESYRKIAEAIFMERSLYDN